MRKLTKPNNDQYCSAIFLEVAQSLLRYSTFGLLIKLKNYYP